MSLRALVLAVIAIVIVGVAALLAALFLLKTPALKGAAVGGLIGVIGSIVTGALTQVLARHLRRTGELRRRLNAWMSANNGAEMESRTFSIRLLNERDTGTALWDLQVVFYKDGKAWLSQKPQRTRYQIVVDVVDIPPYETVTQVLQIRFNTVDPALTKARESDRIVLVAEIPGGAMFEESLPLWNLPESPLYR